MMLMWGCSSHQATSLLDEPYQVGCHETGSAIYVAEWHHQTESEPVELSVHSGSQT